jgi:hypothetical protein
VAIWLVVLRSATGNWLGSAVFAEYNWTAALQIGRIPLVVLRRCYQIGISNFHWLALALVIWPVTKFRALRGPEWKLVAALIAAYVLLHSVLGGAILLRYLLPALALFYICAAAAIEALPANVRRPGFALLLAGLAVSNWWNPPYPFSYEDNLAVVDFVRLQQQGARWLSAHVQERAITTAWPLTQALTDLRGGYISHPLHVQAVEDFQPKAWESIAPSSVEVIALYSRSWDPPHGLQRQPFLAGLLERYFGYRAQSTPEALMQRFHLHTVARWETHGQWLEILAR